MRKTGMAFLGTAAVLAVASLAWAQTTTSAPAAKPVAKPATSAATPAPTAPNTAEASKQPFDPLKLGASPPPPPMSNAKPVALVLRGLDKITGRPAVITAPINEPVKFATLTITARYCYSTPQSETPETSAFLQIEDHRPDQSPRQVFSGWMYASSPGLNGMQHPLYDVWVITCKTNAPGEAKAVPSTAPVKPVSPNAGATDEKVDLPEDADQ